MNSMNVTRNITARALRLGFLAIVASLAFISTSKAVDFDTYVYTKYGWTRVVPGSGTGGYVRWSSSLGYYTDRASRGETVCPVFRATIAGETSGAARAEYTCGNQSLGTVAIPGSRSFTLSTNPGCDSLHVFVRSNCNLERRRPVPIGSRPSNY